MIEFVIIEISAIFLATLFLLHRYAAKDVSPVTKMFVFLTWLLCFVIIILVPLDVYYTRITPEGTTTPEKELLETIWKITYWSSYAICWVILPVLWEYVENGEFSTETKFKRALKATIISYAIYGVGAVAIIIYLVLSGTLGNYTLKEFLVTFANCYGVFLIILCLGFGIVQIPKRFLQKTNKNINLKYYQFHLAEAEEDKTNLQIELEDLIKVVYLLSVRKDVEASLKSLLDTVLAQCSEETIKTAKQSLNSADNETANEFGEVTRDKVAEINQKLKRKIAEVKRHENQYETTLKEAILAENVLQSMNPSEWAERNSAEGKTGCMNTLKWLWYTKVEQIFFMLLGLVAGVFSLGAFFAEVLTFQNIPFFNLENIIQQDDSFFKNQVICLVPLLYICLCVYYSLFKMKLGGLYGLYPNKHTDASSLIFVAVNFSRVSTPLVFNFLQMVKVQNTAFITIMGNFNANSSFTKYCPFLLVLLVLFNVFDVYGRILAALGLSRFKFSENFNDDKLEEGRVLLERARKARGFSPKDKSVISSKTPNETTSYSLNTKLLGRPVDVSDLETDDRSGSPDKLIGSRGSKRPYF